MGRGVVAPVAMLLHRVRPLAPGNILPDPVLVRVRCPVRSWRVLVAEAVWTGKVNQLLEHGSMQEGTLPPGRKAGVSTGLALTRGALGRVRTVSGLLSSSGRATAVSGGGAAGGERGRGWGRVQS